MDDNEFNGNYWDNAFAPQQSFDGGEAQSYPESALDNPNAGGWWSPTNTPSYGPDYGASMSQAADNSEWNPSSDNAFGQIETVSQPVETEPSSGWWSPTNTPSYGSDYGASMQRAAEETARRQYEDTLKAQASQAALQASNTARTQAEADPNYILAQQQAASQRAYEDQLKAQADKAALEASERAKASAPPQTGPTPEDTARQLEETRLRAQAAKTALEEADKARAAGSPRPAPGSVRVGPQPVQPSTPEQPSSPPPAQISQPSTWTPANRSPTQVTQPAQLPAPRDYSSLPDMDPTVQGQGELSYGTPGVRGVLDATTRSQNALDTVTAQLTNPTGYETGLYSAAQGLGQLGTGETFGQGQARYATSGLSDIASGGEAASAFRATAKPVYNAPSEIESAFRSSINPALSKGTALENWYKMNSNAMGGPGAVSTSSQGIESGIDKAGNTGTFYGQNQAQMASKGYQEKLADAYQPITAYSDELYTGGAGAKGLDDYYSNLIARGTRQIDEAGAARGSFNSGASLRGVEELNRDLSAQQAKDYIALANQADANRLAMLQYGQGVMAGGDTGRNARFQTGMAGASSADQAALAQSAARLGLAGAKESEAQNRYKLAADTAGAAGQQTIARNTALGQTASQASNAALERATQAVTAGKTVDDLKLSALSKAGELGLATDTMRQNALSAQATAAAQGQNALVSRTSALSEAANKADTVATTRAAANQVAAASAQALRDGRISTELDYELRAIQQQVNQAALALNAAQAESLSLALEEIQQELQKAGVDSKVIQAKIDNLRNNIATGLSLADTALSLYGGKAK